MSEINNVRSSAPTGVNETVNEMNKKASDPLGDATCSASCFGDMRADTIAMLESVIALSNQNLPKAIKLKWTEQIENFRNMKEKALTDLSRISSM